MKDIGVHGDDELIFDTQIFENVLTIIRSFKFHDQDMYKAFVGSNIDS